MQIIIGLLTLLLLNHAVADTGWTGHRTILSLETTGSGTEFRLEGYGGGCTPLNENGVQKTWAKISSTQENKEQMLSVLLMAFATSKTINVYCIGSAHWVNADHIVVGVGQ